MASASSKRSALKASLLDRSHNAFRSPAEVDQFDAPSVATCGSRLRGDRLLAAMRGLFDVLGQMSERALGLRELFDRFAADPEVIRTRPSLSVIAASVDRPLGHNRKSASTADHSMRRPERRCAVADRRRANNRCRVCSRRWTASQTSSSMIRSASIMRGLPLVSRSPPVDASPGNLGMLSPFPAIEVEPPHRFRVLQHQIDRIWTPNANASSGG